MMKIYRKWDYDLIVSTALGAANSIGISLNEKDRTRIEQIVRRFCERTNSGKNDSLFLASSLYVVVYNEGLEIKTYINYNLNYNPLNSASIGAPCGEFYSAAFVYSRYETVDKYKYFITIK